LSKQENKDKLRVYEYAKSLNMSSKEIITILKRLDVPVNNHMSVMENDAVRKVEQFFRDVKAGAAAKRSGEPPSSGPAKADNRPSEQGNKTRQQDSRPNQQGQGKPKGASGPNGSRANGEKKTGDNRHAGRDNNRQRGEKSREAVQRQTSAQPRQDQPRLQQSSPEGRGGLGDHRRGGENGRRGNDGQQRRAEANGHRQRGGQQQGARLQEETHQQGRVRDLSDGTVDFIANRGKTTKKTKPNQKRFDDNKVSTSRGGNQGKFNPKNNKGRPQESQGKKEKADNTPKKIIVRGTMTTGELAKLLHKDVSEVIKKLLLMGAMVTINQELDLDTIQLLADDYGVEVEVKIPVEEDKFELLEEKDDEADLVERPPVVTIMGHVDHGKTTLLDAIRHTKVTEGEAGGITQHIGAYQVEINGKKITFLDTPGHEAFTTMRSRGAQITDITILVVAADDGVMPQTVEAINHAKAANVPIIVAVNKIDKPEANPDKIKQELTEYGLVPEEWGGDTIFVNVSAKQRIGLENLLEMILLVAEVQEYKANPNKRARGTVIEAELDKGRGPVARVLIQHGTLKVGDSFVAGVCFGRVRVMVNDKGKRLKEAGPSTPVEITGLNEVPMAGDPFIVFEDERKARAIAEKRATTQRENELGAHTRVTLDDLYKHIQEGEIKELNVIIKGDVQGSVEALRGSLEKIDIEGVRVRILHTGVGAITESDVILASASNAIIIGFNVRPEPLAKNTAEQEKVDIRLHRVIYNAIDEIEAALKGLLDPIYKENIIGHAEVRNLFKISRVGTIAGCMVTDGKITRSAEARVIRNGIVVYEGAIDTLKRFKDDAREVAQGFECGITLERFNDIKEGDIIEAFVMETVER
jgi:translation initiation factor IF-2